MKARSIRFRLTVWYAGLLAAVLVLAGASVYAGLGRYLERALEESLRRQARSIAESFLAAVDRSGEAYVVDEIREHFAPEINGRFVRVTRQRPGRSAVLYASGPARDGSFDPGPLALPGGARAAPPLRYERLPGGGDLLVHTLAFTAPDGNAFLVEAGAPYGPIRVVERGLGLAFALALPLLVALSIGGGYLLMRRALAPIDAITRAAESISSRNLAERLPIPATGDEIERLSLSLNRMVARLERAFQQAGRFSADASHELRTPLAILRGELEAIARRTDLAPDARDTLASALEETEHLGRIVAGLLELSRLDAGEARLEPVRLDLGALAATTAEQMRLLAEDKGVELVCAGGPQIAVEGDRARLKQVVVNLLDNAIKYTPRGGKVEIRVRAAPGEAIVEVSDDGVGIPRDALPHLFERFYRADSARSRALGGAGLGLSIVHSIASAHAGRVEVESSEGGGSRFRVVLPCPESMTGAA
jgi:signal transduction histidine kinase